MSSAAGGRDQTPVAARILSNGVMPGRRSIDDDTHGAAEHGSYVMRDRPIAGSVRERYDEMIKSKSQRAAVCEQADSQNKKDTRQQMKD